MKISEVNNIAGEIENYLSEHGVRPSYQRIKIYEYLIKNRNHPTVDMIYSSLAPSIPTLSRTTVYNTLNLFVDKKVAIVLDMKDSESRYDADVSIHGHFKCEKCGKIYDFGVDASKLEHSGLENFQIDELQISFKGICANCKNNI